VHYICKSVILNSHKSGGLDFLDFDNSFKINWLKFCLNKPSLWNFIPNFIFDQFGGLSFLLMCDYKIDKLPVKLSAFHAQALLAFSPQRCFICNNCCILYKQKYFSKKLV